MSSSKTGLCADGYRPSRHQEPDSSWLNTGSALFTHFTHLNSNDLDSNLRLAAKDIEGKNRSEATSPTQILRKYQCLPCSRPGKLVSAFIRRWIDPKTSCPTRRDAFALVIMGLGQPCQQEQVTWTGIGPALNFAAKPEISYMRLAIDIMVDRERGNTLEDAQIYFLVALYAFHNGAYTECSRLLPRAVRILCFIWKWHDLIWSRSDRDWFVMATFANCIYFEMYMIIRRRWPVFLVCFMVGLVLFIAA
ncbi:hypothetical protein CCHR01_17085 [Colletotrichum chrysophilum]|uniref:Uncharacterized protein n=1 Tax=Colletotrichum chrysophilum TaxID=1836956 RepID=A0AAD9E9F8_9PEZI|nr:hypothetical protein CCHR01_17085 [Colletotrichum chrysophilum]